MAFIKVTIKNIDPKGILQEAMLLDVARGALPTTIIGLRYQKMETTKLI